jgi:uroporphyrinogen-III synthase
MDMPRVLLTRPLASSEAMAGTLQKLGYEITVEPLLSVVPLPAPCPPIDAPDAVMITSGNALMALEGRSAEAADLLGAPCFCVGPGTADKASAFGFRDVQNSTGDGAELARFMDAALTKRPASVLHIAGRDADSRAREILEKSGHRVTSWIVYETLPAADFTAVTRTLLENQKLEAILLFSPRTAQVLANLLKKTALEACCTGLAAICLSDTVAKVLRPLGWRHLVAVPKPAEEAVIACLLDLCPVKS